MVTVPAADATNTAATAAVLNMVTVPAADATNTATTAAEMEEAKGKRKTTETTTETAEPPPKRPTRRHEARDLVLRTAESLQTKKRHLHAFIENHQIQLQRWENIRQQKEREVDEAEKVFDAAMILYKDSSIDA